MSEKKNAMANVIISLIIGIILGTILIVISSMLNFYDLVYWGLVIIGIITIISNVAPFVNGLANIKKTSGVIDFIFATLGIILGFMLIFMQNTVIGDILPIILAIYLIIFPIIRIILAKNAWKEQFKKEWIKILIGVLIIAFLPAIFGAFADVFNLVLLIAGWSIIGISVLVLVVAIISRVSSSKKA